MVSHMISQLQFFFKGKKKVEKNKMHRVVVKSFSTPLCGTTSNPFLAAFLFIFLRASSARVAILAVHYSLFFILATSFSLHAPTEHLF
jgi:hypothetical protein